MVALKKLRYNNDISADRVRTLLSYDPATGEFIRIFTNSRKMKAGGIAGGINVHGYKVIGLDGRIYLAHRIAWLYVYGVWPEFDIDHINGDRSDCRLMNLRAAENHQNLWNRGKQRNNKSGYKNVSWSKPMNKWEVRLRRNGQQIIVGYSESLEQAAQMAHEARLKYHGEFAK